MSYVFHPAPVASLSIVGMSKRFPVRRVFCVGRNYAAHAIEMGDDPTRDEPFFFCKDRECLVPVELNQSVTIAYPSATQQLEYEAELVVALSQGGSELTLEQAKEAVYGYAVGVDLTRRDLQSAAKAKGRPWDAGKAFDQSAPISAIVPKSNWAPSTESVISLSVDGIEKQHSTLSCLIWSVPELIVKLSRQFNLAPGDVILTGTPENVGPVAVGETMLVTVEGLGSIQVTIN